MNNSNKGLTILQLVSGIVLLLVLLFAASQGDPAKSITDEPDCEPKFQKYDGVTCVRVEP